MKELKPSELRIGNYIHTLVSGIPVKSIVCGISQNEVKSRIIVLKKIEVFPEHLRQPIPITEQWLLDFGFVNEDNLFRYSRFKLSHKKEYNYFYVIDNLSLTYLTKLEFVHELQNFVHIMDGEELILNK